MVIWNFILSYTFKQLIKVTVITNECIAVYSGCCCADLVVTEEASSFFTTLEFFIFSGRDYVGAAATPFCKFIWFLKD